MSELWGILFVAQVAWNANISHLWIERDSKLAVQFVSEGVNREHPFKAMVDLIRGWLGKEWHVKVSQVYQEQNVVADYMENVFHGVAYGLHLLSHPLVGTDVFLICDAIGLSMTRSIRV